MKFIVHHVTGFIRADFLLLLETFIALLKVEFPSQCFVDSRLADRSANQILTSAHIVTQLSIGLLTLGLNIICIWRQGCLFRGLNLIDRIQLIDEMRFNVKSPFSRPMLIARFYSIMISMKNP